MSPKIKSQNEIIGIVRKLKEKGKKVVAYNGSFDILHLGHIRSFKEAKKQGDILIVLLNSDKSIKSYKGPLHPINPQKVRAEILSAIGDIDYIVIFDEINPKLILGKIKPDIYCKGPDWGKNCIERSEIEANGGKVHILNWQAGLSTTDLARKIIGMHCQEEVKAVFLDRDGTINANRIGCVRNINQFKFLPKTLSALKKLSKTGYKVIIITNQSGIGRGYFTHNGLKQIHQKMIKEIKRAGGKIDKIYYCPHLPEVECLCRKPKIGMILNAGKDFKLNLSKSWFVGDDDKDVFAGREANVKTIKIGALVSESLKLAPDYYAKNLLEAVEIITKLNK